MEIRLFAQAKCCGFTASQTMRTLGIFAVPGKPQAIILGRQLAELATRHGLEVREQFDQNPIPLTGDSCMVRDEVASSDVLVCLSGDGGVLAAARAAANFNTPILSVDLGRLGFLSTVRPDELGSAFFRLLDGEFEIEERMMLDARVFRSDESEKLAKLLTQSETETAAFEVGGGSALNDAVVAKSALARILRLSIYASGELVAQIRADGLIVSTPTGSTAYALSAGGPIVPPDVPLLLVAPICAHTLNQRPFVVGAGETLDVQAEWEGDEVQPDRLDTMLTLDGQVGVSLRPGDIVRVRRSSQITRLLRDPNDSFYARLRFKMAWGN